MIAGLAIFVAVCETWNFVEGLVASQTAMGRALIAGAATFVLAIGCGALCWWVWRNVR